MQYAAHGAYLYISTDGRRLLTIFWGWSIEKSSKFLVYPFRYFFESSSHQYFCQIYVVTTTVFANSRKKSYLKPLNKNFDRHSDPHLRATFEFEWKFFVANCQDLSNLSSSGILIINYEQGSKVKTTNLLIISFCYIFLL